MSMQTEEYGSVGLGGPSRRAFLFFAGAAGGWSQSPVGTYETQAKGIRILPGQWRPHYPFEQIAWISPPWPSQDYLWLDFPEAIFSSQGLLYLSHVNPPFPVVFPNLPKAPWRIFENGIGFERELPNGIRFGGKITRQGESLVALELRIHNGSRQPLKRISLQTCAFLRAIREFADFTRANKYIHLPKSGWTPLTAKLPSPQLESGPYRVGWRHSGSPVADLPVIVTLSNKAERLVAMTWHTDTLSLVSNPEHPCMHADPHFPDLGPGASAAVHGHIVFFEGNLRNFDYRKASGGPRG